MNRILLVTRPKYDDGTEYLAYYASLIIKDADSRSIENKDFEGKDAKIENVKKFIKKKDPKLIFINGHGDTDCLLGDNHEVLFSVSSNLDLLKERIVYARACNAGLIFGKKVTENSNGCFIGYQLPFSFIMNEKWSAIPANDKTAALFIEPSNEVMHSLIKGDSAALANEKSKKAMIKNMQRIMKMEEKKEPGAMGLLMTLWNNYDGQVLHGNQNITF
jgi:hypothetical protein